MPMLLQIRGYRLPGRVWQSRDEQYHNIHVGIQDGKEPRELVRGDAETPSWTVPSTLWLARVRIERTADD